MLLSRCRRSAALSTIVLTTFLATLLPTRPARADDPPAPGPSTTDGVGGPTSLNVPQGGDGAAASVGSATVDPSTGALSASFPIDLPKARGGVQPHLALSYNSSSGVGIAGPGWSLGIPSIERHNLSGAPTFADPLSGAKIDVSKQDRFTFGGAPLVPICFVDDGPSACSRSNKAGAPEQMPTWATGGWHYYRLEHENGTLLRFFWSPGHERWRVQDPSGATLEFGIPTEDLFDRGSVDIDPTTGSVYRWNLAREWDAQRSAAGVPNKIVYVWTPQTDSTSGIRLGYLTDIYDTPAAPDSQTSAFAHHAHLAYDAFPLPASNGVTRVWAARPIQQLSRIDVSSSSFTSMTREQLRRYFFDYTLDGYTQHLTSVTLEGACPQGSNNIENNGQLPPPASARTCPQQLPTKLGYSIAAAQPKVVDLGHPLPGWAPTLWTSSLPTILDINADGLPDFVAPPLHATDTTQQLALNSLSGGWTTASIGFVNQALGAGPLWMNPGMANFHAGNFNSDGRINVLLLGTTSSSTDPHGSTFPTFQTTQYAMYTPAFAAGQWVWSGGLAGQVMLDRSFWGGSSSAQQMREGLENDFATIDIDGDGLEDLLSAQYYVYFDGLFRPITQQYLLDLRRTTEDVSGAIKPFSTLLPLPIHDAPTFPAFEPNVCVGGANTGDHLFDKDHPAVFADINADGLPDWAALGPDFVHVWMGHGDGIFGFCPDGTANCSCDVANYQAWTGADPGTDLSKAHLHDVDADGRADLVLQNGDNIDVYFNFGAGFGNKLTVPIKQKLGWPLGQGDADLKILFADMNGSGVDDIVAINPGGAVAYIDMMGAARPSLLTDLDNGHGVRTHVEYASSPAMEAAARNANKAWTSHTPQAIAAVTSITTRGSASLADNYRVEYEYSSPVYDARERGFVGFGAVTTRKVAQGFNPLVTQTTFYQGHCGADVNIPCTGQTDYYPSAFRGLPILTEVTSGGPDAVTALSTVHRTFRGQPLRASMDGRQTRRVFASQTDTFLYDTAPFSSGVSTISNLQDIDAPELSVAVPFSAKATQGTAHLQSSSTIDPYSGLIVGSVDSGLVSSTGASLGGTIVTGAKIQVIPQDTTEYWTWRTITTSTSGTDSHQAALGRERATRADYDAHGNVLHRWATLTGTKDLVRSHDAGLSFASPPGNRSKDQEVLLETTTYRADGTGLPQRIEGANGRCSDVDYDPLFTQLPTTTTSYSNGCGNGAITSSRSWHRGFGVTTLQADANGTTTSAFDGFGRPIAMSKPDPATGAPGATAVSIDYPDDLEQGPLHLQRVHVRTFDGGVARDSWRFMDGFGRSLFAFAPSDPLTDPAPWIVSGQQTRDTRGRVIAKYPSRFYAGPDPSGDPLTVFQSVNPTGPAFTYQYDDFDRVIGTVGLDGVRASKVDFHALSRDVYDAEQLPGGGHVGAFTTVDMDGHGRRSGMVQHANGTLLVTRLGLWPTGEVASIARTATDGTGAVVQNVSRWMDYDSFGRLVLNAEPNTSPNFASASPTDIKAWRYAYDDSGDLVGTSDARGCGENLTYDGLGRLVSEDYSPCIAAQEPYTQPSSSGPDGTEAYYRYDAEPSTGSSAGTDLVGDGHLHEIFDRASHSRFHLDRRGRSVAVERRLAKPGPSHSDVASRYANHWFEATAAYDDLDRVIAQSTGADVPELLAAPLLVSGLNIVPESVVYTSYTPRGTVRNVSTSYDTNQPILKKLTFDADGLPTEVDYGDGASTIARFQYDVLRRASNTQISRPHVAPGLLEATSIDMSKGEYDRLGNPKVIHDNRSFMEWDPGRQPVALTTVGYDDFYRATTVDYTYTSATGDDLWTDTSPSPTAVPQSPANNKRTIHRDNHFDAMGNITSSDDDAHAFYDRSTGVATPPDPNAPNQLRHAEASGVNGGKLDADYDAAGNLTVLRVGRNGKCDDPNQNCSHRFDYTWDEVGRLVHTHRLDFEVNHIISALPGLPFIATPWTDPALLRIPEIADALFGADVAYAYDCDGQRVLRTSTRNSNVTTSAEVFPSLRLNNAHFDGTDYERTPSTETAYLLQGGAALGRVVYALDDPNTLTSGRLHVLLELTDRLGSTSSVLDRDTGELVERLSYSAWGSVDSDYRPAKWASFRESYRFTGKEDDSEAGLVYFGARYYAPALMRFISADPLTIHGAGADLNPYAYVHGRVFSAVDPDGRDDYGYAQYMGGGSGVYFWSMMPDPYPSGQYSTPPPTQAFSGSSLVSGLGSLAGDGWSRETATLVQEHQYASLSIVAVGVAAATVVGFITMAEFWAPITYYTGVAYQQATYYTGVVSLHVTELGLAQQGIVIGGGAAGVGVVAETVFADVEESGGVNPSTIEPVAEDLVTVYRGVSSSHPGYKDALQGRVFPRGGHYDVFEHNAGNTESAYTSWTTAESVAERFASRSQTEGGVLLQARVPRSSLVWSPDMKNEAEVLIQGPVLNATPIRTVPPHPAGW